MPIIMHINSILDFPHLAKLKFIHHICLICKMRIGTLNKYNMNFDSICICFIRFSIKLIRKRKTNDKKYTMLDILQKLKA